MARDSRGRFIAGSGSGKRNEVVDIDHGWKAMMERARTFERGSHAKVGVLADSEQGGLHEKGPDGKASPLTLAEIAAVLELGTKDGHIPSRSFIRATFDRMKTELGDELEKLLAKVVLDGTLTAEQAYDRVGAMLSSAMKAAIVDGGGIPPPLAPSTVAGRQHTEKKGFIGPVLFRPLYRTGVMARAIMWAVVRNGIQGEAKGGK